MRFALAVLPLAVASSLAQANPVSNLNISGILNGGYTVRDSEPESIGGYPLSGHGGALPEGFWLDHTELALSGNVDDLFYGKLTTVLESHDGETELELEEAFIQTLSLPAGLGVRAGRFLAEVGYLNSKHAHTDYFADRPLPAQAFLGGHYFDDGVRLNWVAPTDLYLELGAEAFAGTNFPAASGERVGATNLFANLGGDIGSSQSWQTSLSWLQADADPDHCSADAHAHGHEEEHEGDHEGEEEHDEEHGHGIDICGFKGDRDLLVAAAVWKWAPGGNFKYQSLTVLGEFYRQDERGEMAHDDHFDQWRQTSYGGYLSAAWQFNPNWTLGVRGSYVEPGDGYGDDKATAYDAMIQYNHSHFSTVRLQYSREERDIGVRDDVLTLQYVMSLGDHGAHQF